MSEYTCRAVVRLNLLLAASVFVSDEVASRYYLTGVHIEPHPEKGAILTGTNGHVIATVHDEIGHVEGAGQTWFVPATLLTSLAKGMRSHGSDAFVMCEYGSAPGKAPYVRLVSAYTGDAVLAGDGIEVGRVEQGEVSLKKRELLIDGVYPSYRRILFGHRPTGKVTPFWFNADYMVDIAKCGRYLHGLSSKTTVPIMLENEGLGLGDSCAPTRVFFDGHPEAMLLIMPMRGGKNSEPPGEPEWLEALRPPPEALAA